MIPRIVIAGVSSGVGKTSVSIAVMKGLREKGYSVQGFKTGPDYIDPSYHTSITGRESRNLDPWLMGERGLLESFHSATEDADFAVIEGVMGLFDGLSGRSNFASTAHTAKLLKSPVLLVLDASKAARSVAAIALGFVKFDSKIKIAGLILNNAAGEKHATYCTDAIRQKVKIPVLGTVKRNKEVVLEERHLGLVPTRERGDAQEKVSSVAKYVQAQLDLDRIAAAAKKAAPLPRARPRKIKEGKFAATIAVALDESFNFYYADNLETLRALGADLTFFSPVSDEKLPHTDGIYLGGGFPEVLADRLEENTSMIRSIRHSAGDSAPVYAECGGLMYLTRSIREFDGRKHSMVNLFDADTVMEKQLTLGYTEARVAADSLIAGAGRTTIRGHEFHYSKIENLPEDASFAYELLKGRGISRGLDGLTEYNTLASYMHLHFANRKLAENLLLKCRKYGRR